MRVNTEPFPGYTAGRGILALGSLLTLCSNPAFSFDIPSAALAGSVLQQTNLFSVAGQTGGKIAGILGLLLVISGWRPRITGPLQWWISWSIPIAFRLPDGGDHITSNLALILLPVTLLDSRQWVWREPAERASALRKSFFAAHGIVIRVQVSLIYLHAAFAKLDITEWVNGTALYYWLTSPMYGAPLSWQQSLATLLSHPWVVLVATWSVIAFEFTLAGAVFLSKEKRVKLLLPAAGFHAMIAVFLGLSSFFFAMLGALVLYCGFAPDTTLMLSRAGRVTGSPTAGAPPRRLQTWLRLKNSSS
ncbi:MAG: HTTM domain-containing protein [Thermoanaerobaculia bacterium]|nr:HTTM domain-containing protein [Thermoanaerobaculia bacterium]